MFGRPLFKHADIYSALFYPTLCCKFSQWFTFSSCLPSFLVTPAVSFQKKTISYSLLINPSSLFSISAETGEISLTRPIDYESDQHRYLLLVRASEGLDSMSSAAEVCVCLCLCLWCELHVTFPLSNSMTALSSKIFFTLQGCLVKP